MSGLKRRSQDCPAMLRAIVMAATCAGGADALAQDQSEAISFTVYSSVDYSSGDYGAVQKTDILYAPFGVKASVGEWSLRATSGYIRIDGPGGVIGAGGAGPIVAPDQRRPFVFQESGLADTLISLTYSPTLKGPEIYLDLTAKVKAPTADRSKGLGTGKTDITLQAEVSKFIGPVLPFAMVGYRFVGAPDDFTLNDAWLASAGAAYYVTRTVSIGASYDFRQAASPLAQDSEEIFAYFDVKATKRWSLMGYGVAGLSDGGPDHAFGLQLKLRGL